MLDHGKYRGRKDKKKLSSTVNEVKNEYNSLRQACRLPDISWSKFHRFTYVKLEVCKKLQYTRKLSAAQIAEIQEYYTSNEVSFPLPDKKYANKRFLHTSVTKCTKMYNMLATTTRKISTATFYKYKPKAVKLQGHIPFRQSCCKKGQNFENITNEAAKYLHGVSNNIGDCIDQSMCSYTGYFPNIQCFLHTCIDCSVNKFKAKILAANRDKLSDARKRFLVKLWITKTERKEGKVQSFLHWKFERCSYLQIINLLQKHITSMAEHSFMASWNYWQYKLARRNIIKGDVIMVHDFAQNYLCTHQNEVQGLHWHHQQVTVMPTVAHYLCTQCKFMVTHEMVHISQVTVMPAVAHYLCTQCKCMVTHEMVHISDDLKHDAQLIKAFTTQSEQILEDSGIAIHKIIGFTDQAPSQYKNKTAFHYFKDRKFPVVKNLFGVHHGNSSCDACTGRVKQGVTRLVKAGTEVVNSAQTFYECCVKHLQKPKTTACQHYVPQFELHKKLKSRPDTKKWPAVPDTRTYHSVANMQNDNLDVRTFPFVASVVCTGMSLVLMSFAQMIGNSTIIEAKSFRKQIGSGGWISVKIRFIKYKAMLLMSWITISRMSLIGQEKLPA